MIENEDRIGPVAVTAETAAMCDAVAAAVDAGAFEMRHVEHCTCVGTDRMTADCVQRTYDLMRHGTVRCASAPRDVPAKCTGPLGADVDPNPCSAPGSLLRCQLCPSSPTYWRHTRDRQHSTRCPLTPVAI